MIILHGRKLTLDFPIMKLYLGYFYFNGLVIFLFAVKSCA